ncbi:hypothetical protein BC827DRAFT_529056 [Russula dissimulans]|nr:hypothetical protein BC827DRAFT_529056 [Russula dissimulans]
MPSDHRPQMLEVEDVEQRQKRLHILEKLNGVPSTAESSNLSFDFGVRTTFAMEPPTELLARVRQFLPEIEQSNAELLQRDPRSIDMEHIEETDERVVQMDLGLGIFEQRQTRGHSISSSSSGTSSFASRAHPRRNSPSNLSASNSSSSSSPSDEDDGENEDSSSCSSRLTLLSQKPANQIIQVLASRNEEEPLSGDHPVP